MKLEDFGYVDIKKNKSYNCFKRKQHINWESKKNNSQQ